MTKEKKTRSTRARKRKDTIKKKKKKHTKYTMMKMSFLVRCNSRKWGGGKGD